MVTYAKLSEIIGAVAASVTAIFKQYSATLWSSHWHNGIDIGCAANTPIMAVADGVIVDACTMTARSFDGFGNRVIVEHEDGICSLYAHLIKPCTLNVGDKVTKGQIIGYAGGTGKKQYSYAPHLHFTLLKGFDKAKYNIFYSNNELLDPIKVCGLGELEFSSSCNNTILENGVKKSLGNLNEYYAGYPAVDIPDEDVPRADTPEAEIKVGSTVMLRNGAKTYNGGKLAAFVYYRPHIVSEIKGDRAVICYDNIVIAAVNVGDLTLTAESLASIPTTPKIKVGSTVTLRRGAKTYNGGKLAAFVYDRPHIVNEIKGDRAVITFGGVVVAAVNVNDLTLA